MNNDPSPTNEPRTSTRRWVVRSPNLQAFVERVNNLVTFPAAESEDRGVSFVHLPEAVYDRGKSRTNRKEAEAIVADAVVRMKRNLQLPEDQRLTFGVITFNSQQQSGHWLRRLCRFPLSFRRPRDRGIALPGIDQRLISRDFNLLWFGASRQFRQLGQEGEAATGRF